VEGLEVLDALNVEYVDGNGRPFRDIRVLHTAVLDDPYDDPSALEVCALNIAHRLHHGDLGDRCMFCTNIYISPHENKLRWI
jgi:hypothetical protein